MSLPARRSLLRLLAPLALMAAIFYLSAQTFDGRDLAWWEVAGRKLGHFGGYALLAALWVWALAGRVRRPLALAAAISVLYAVSDEYHQSFVEGRTGTVRDVAIDALGIATACALLVNRRPQVAKTKPGKDAGRPPKRAYESGT